MLHYFAVKKILAIPWIFSGRHEEKRHDMNGKNKKMVIHHYTLKSSLQVTSFLCFELFPSVKFLFIQ